MARFIVAPHGYGKTTLAVEYAETMFSWAHTFWVNAKSPCFIRDLDNDDFAEALKDADPSVGLVVFDDVPALDDERSQAFSQAIDKLIEVHCEVMVTCCPAGDSLASLQIDRCLLGPRDLLLDDDELDAVRPIDERSRIPSSQLSAVHRIALLAWPPSAGSAAEKEARERFARVALSDDLPSDFLLAMASALVLRTGTLDQLQSFTPLAVGQLKELARDYPHLSFDEGFERFEVPAISMDELSPILKKSLAKLARLSAFESGEHLVRSWADSLMRSGKAARACNLIRAAYPRESNPDWLASNSYELVRRSCFLPMLQLVQVNSRPKGASKRTLHAIEALCRRILGDSEGALRRAKLCAFDESAPLGVRIIGLTIMSETADMALQPQIESALGEVASALRNVSDGPGNGRKPAHGASGAPSFTDGEWALFAEAQLASRKGFQELAHHWLACEKAPAHEDMLAVIASWLFGLADASSELAGPDAVAALRSCERFVRRRLADSGTSPLDFFAASAGLAMEEAHGRGMRYEAGPLEAATLIKLRNYEMSVLSQRRGFEDERRNEQVIRQDWMNTHPSALMVHDPLVPEFQIARNTPILTLKLFGCFDAAIGGVPIDRKKFSRKNTRSLLVLLAANGGREVSREAIVSAMWPGRSAEAGKKNLYTVWSNLRAALSLPDGTCPYLLRHQFGCSLDPRYVHSDVERLEEICRELLFGVPNVEQWSLLFSELDRDFSYELMPSERKNPMINQVRQDYRNRLVDALTGATVNLVDAAMPQWGVWFARMALKHDETREDVYIALMRAQIACNQRTAAMMTYLKCREVLSQRLGIDPSAEAQALYKSLLDSE